MLAAKRLKERAGPWTDDEISYVRRLSLDFKAGLLPDVPRGTSIRPWLARKLRCDPMRISKKFKKGSKLLGIHKYKFKEEVFNSLSPEIKHRRECELKALEAKFEEQVELDRNGGIHRRRRRRKKTQAEEAADAHQDGASVAATAEPNAIETIIPDCEMPSLHEDYQEIELLLDDVIMAELASMDKQVDFTTDFSVAYGHFPLKISLPVHPDWTGMFTVGDDSYDYYNVIVV
ncbi:hypothetical protein LEN26_007869 [Aphanomyces euteiches]|nr:hypothetical protein AeMF1_018957 [Aphanomyces euteiches]KAH9131164.1 hypothetical protein LEN26_007869 [Aphanomyces euteiches]KAH9190893.1 hypothetical protein AeNC1_007133 [Aphanomyces euteiches]